MAAIYDFHATRLASNTHLKRLFAALTAEADGTAGALEAFRDDDKTRSYLKDGQFVAWLWLCSSELEVRWGRTAGETCYDTICLGILPKKKHVADIVDLALARK